MILKLKRIFALTEQGAKDLIKSTIWCSVTNLSLMFPVGLIMLVLERMISALNAGTDPSAGVAGITVTAAIILAVIFVLHWFQYKSLYIATYDESANRRVRLAEKLRQLPLSFFGNRDLSDLTSTIMADCSSLEQSFSHYIPQLFGTCISTVLIALGLLCMSWRLAIAVLWVIPVALMLLIFSKLIQDRMGLKSILAKRAATDGIQECLETIRDIKACNQKGEYLRRLNKKIADAESATIHSELATGVSVTSAQAILRLGLATTVLTGSGMLMAGEIDLMTYLIFLIAATRLYEPISLSFTNIAATFNAILQIGRMRSIEEQPVQEGIKEFSPENYDIVFEGVRFAYNENEGVLSNVSFTARQGEVTALVGPSGGGKSTAAKLAARFWDANSGSITLGGTDVTTVEPETLLKSYAIVFQDVVLFNDSVIENIRLGRRDASDDEVIAAARMAQCDEFIKRLPDGYMTVIGENGSNLSGGERQRISIARALLKDAPVILLDEATASLDVENESAVQDALSHLVRNKTVLIIAHRMRTVAGADKIVVLKDGMVEEQGSPAELLKRNGLYSHMVELQKESSNWQIK